MIDASNNAEREALTPTETELIATYRALPAHLKSKMQKFVSLAQNGSERAHRLAKLKEDGRISLHQLLEAI